VRDEILSHHEMIARERCPLQGGMIFHARPGMSVVLMSQRSNAPYHDRWDDERNVLIYHGHNTKRISGQPDPNTVDQPLTLPSGKPTANGKFYAAAKRAASGDQNPEVVRVYDKIKQNVWVDKGLFHLIDARIETIGGRNVIEFLLAPVADDTQPDMEQAVRDLPHTRIIPSDVIQAVWKRDRGRCVRCGSTTNLHLDHLLPFAKGGSSLVADNIQILCAKHNLAKSDKIE
jgi:hypothetical protein